MEVAVQTYSLLLGHVKEQSSSAGQRLLNRALAVERPKTPNDSRY